MSRRCKDLHSTANRKDDKRRSHVTENKKKPSRKKTRIVDNSHNSRHRKMKENYNKELTCGPVSKGFSPCPFVSTSSKNYRKGSSTGTLKVRCSKKSGNQKQHCNHSSDTSKYLTQRRDKDAKIWDTRNTNIHCTCKDRLRMKRICVCGLKRKKLEKKAPCKCGKSIKGLKENYVLCPSFSFHAHCQCHSHCDKYSDKIRKNQLCECKKSTTSTFHKLCSCFRRKSNTTLSQLSSRQCVCRDSTEESSEFYESSDSASTQDCHQTNKKHVLYPFENIQKIEDCGRFQEKDMPEQSKESCCKCIRKRTKICIKPSLETTTVTKSKKTKTNKKNGYSCSECTQTIREKGGGSKNFTPNGSVACVLKEREENCPLQSSQSNNMTKSSLTLKEKQASCSECQEGIHKPETLCSQTVVCMEETVTRDEKKKKKNKGNRVPGGKTTVMGVMFDIIFWPYVFWPSRRSHSQCCRTSK